MSALSPQMSTMLRRLVRARQEIMRLRIRCGPEEMLEGDYAHLLLLEQENKLLRDVYHVVRNLDEGGYSMHPDLVEPVRAVRRFLEEGP